MSNSKVKTVRLHIETKLHEACICKIIYKSDGLNEKKKKKKNFEQPKKVQVFLCIIFFKLCKVVVELRAFVNMHLILGG